MALVRAAVISTVLILGVATSPAQSTPPGSRPPLAITNVGVIPMDNERVLENQTVLVSEGRITEIGPSESVDVPPDAVRIAGQGRYVLPGLSDMHAHVRRIDGHMPEDYLRQGITVVRNMSGEPSHLEFRDQVRSGSEPGPIFFTAGQTLAGYRISNRHRIIEDPEAGREAVREHVEAGYDYIKVYSFLSLEVYDAILDEAQKLGIPVIGHVSDHVPVSHAITSGQSSLEHFYGYFGALESPSSTLQGEWDARRLFHAVEIDDSKIEELATQTAEAGAWNCPTLWRKDNYLTSPLAQEAWDTPSLRELGHANRMKLVKALHDAGAGLLVGTDDRAEIVHEELALFVEAGLTPFEALRAATVNAAEYLHMMDEIGTVAVGKRANLVMLAANPLEDIHNTSEIEGVVVNGAWIPRE